MGPVVSVVMPVRDGAAFLEQAVRSILGQSLRRLELIVVDDGSRDGTGGILSRLAAGDGRMRVVPSPARGLVAALNCGLGEARGSCVARMDADDVAHPERLVRQLGVLEREPGVAVVGSAWRVIGARGAVRRVVRPPLGAGAVREALGRGNPMAHPSVMLRREAVLALGGYRPCFLHAEDFDLWLRVAERHELVNLPEALLDYREHDGQVSASGIEQRAVSEMAALAGVRARREGRCEGSGPAPADRAMLVRMGMTEAAIDAGIVGRALGSAKDALSQGRGRVARAAIGCALEQAGLHPRTRAHLWLLRVRAALG